MKRMISLSLTICIFLVGMLPVAAETDTDSYNKALLQCLKGLAILPEYSEAAYAPNRQMYTGDYLNALMNIMGEYSYSGTNMTVDAKKNSYVYGFTPQAFTGEFNAITLGEAIRYSLYALGYQEILEQGGRLVSSVYTELQRGITASQNDVLTAEQGAKLLYNTAFASPLKAIRWTEEGEVTRTVDQKESLIYHTRKIYTVTGVVAATEITSLDNESGCGENRIAIGENQYTYESGYANSYLGHKVCAYVKERDIDPHAVIYIEKDSDEMTITQEDFIDVDNSCRRLNYRKEGRTKTVKLQAALHCIYNGKCLRDYQKDDFMIPYGSITLIDNNEDGVYEVAKINLEEQLVVSVISQSTETVFGQYTSAGSIAKLVFNDKEEKIFIEKNGQEAAFTDIAVGDVLNVIRSRNAAEPYIHIKISSNVESGVITEIPADNDSLYIDGVEFDLSYAFLQAKSNNDTMFQKMEFGVEYNFSLDHMGRISYAELNTEGTESYALLYKLSVESGAFDKMVRIKTFDQRGVWETYQLAQKIVLNNTRMEAELAAKHLQRETGNVIKLKRNSENEIKRIETAEESNGYIANTFTRSAPATENFYTGDRSFNGKYFIDTDTTIIVNYNRERSEEEDYGIISYSFLTNAVSYSYTAYGADEFNRAAVIYLELSAANATLKTNLSRFFLVTEKGTVFENEEEVPMLKGICNNQNNVIVKEKDVSLADVKIGDVITVLLDENNYVKNLAVHSTLTEDRTTPFPESLWTDIAVVKGTVDKISPTLRYMNLIDGMRNKKTFRWLNNNVTVSVFYADRERAEVATVNEIEKDDYLIIRFNRNTLNDIVVIR